MLAKKYRLNGSQVEITKTGSKFTNQFFSLITIHNQLNHARFAIIVGKKISPKAVIRNRLKRQIYEVLSLWVSKLSQDIVILPKPNLLSVSQDQIKTALDQIINESIKSSN